MKKLSDLTTLSKEEMHQSALSQLASTCEQSVVGYGSTVSDAFVLDGLNCTTNGHNSTNVVHCPAGSICCNEKCYGSIKDDDVLLPVMESRCETGEL